MEANLSAEGSVKRGEILKQAKYAKPIELVDRGQVLEVLPHVFVLATQDSSPNPQSTPFFIEAPKVRADINDLRQEISEELFEDSLRILADNVGAVDLSPGLSWHNDAVGFAALIASAIHRNQRDKLGFPYIEHPRRVFLNAEWSLNPEDLSESERLVGYQAAWLHDVIEDSAEYFYRPVDNEDLASWGFSQRVISVVLKLTRPQDKSQTENYYRRILLDTTARGVKLADIADNRARWRVQLLSQQERKNLAEKYDHAQEKLLFDPSSEGDWFDLRLDYFDSGPWPQFALPESYELLREMQSRDSVESPFLEELPDKIPIEQLLSNIFSEAMMIVRERIWEGLDPQGSGARWPYELSIEGWYAAYLILAAKAESEPGYRFEADELAKVIDRVDRSSANFQFRQLGLVSKSIKSSDVREILPKAIRLLEDAIRLSTEEGQPSRGSYEHYEAIQRYLARSRTDELLAATTLVFSEGTVPWAQELQKSLVIALIDKGKG